MNYKEWLDEVVAVHKKLVELDNVMPDEVSLCLGTINDVFNDTVGVHIFRGLKKLAEAVGAEIKSDAYDKYFFEYDGCRIYSLEVRGDV